MAAITRGMQSGTVTQRLLPPPASTSASFLTSTVLVLRPLSSHRSPMHVLECGSIYRNSICGNKRYCRIYSEYVGDGEISKAGTGMGLPEGFEKLVEQRNAADLVMDFYDLVNKGEYLQASKLFTEDCVYEDMLFPKPVLGRQEVAKFFEKSMTSMGPELKFSIDDISREDRSAVGVMWHLDWKGKKFPFSNGVSFYRCEIKNGERKIKYGRDIVEPAAKPGAAALVVIRVITSLFRQFPWLANKI